MRRMIDTSKGLPLTLFPENVEQEIVQNIYCILNTIKGSVPCFRSFGVDGNYLHRPVPVAQSAYTVAIADALAFYEPRVQIDSISFTEDPARPGHIYPVLEVTFNE